MASNPSPEPAAAGSSTAAGAPAARPGKALTVSPLAPAGGFPTLPPVAGVRLSAAAAGVRYRDRLDVMLAEIAPGATIAGCFTRSATRSAPVLWCERALAAIAAEGPAPQPTGIVVNSGNANAFTGRAGQAAVEATAAAAAAALGTRPERILIASTGVIGEPLPHERITARMGDLVARLSPEGAEQAARAIMTTDTFPKGAARVVPIDGTPVTIAGFAKGSGMIAPDMATMLAFVFTDAPVEGAALQRMVRAACARSFNAITVDGDTSTSDSVLVAATGRAPIAPITGPARARAGPSPRRWRR
ncbi:MAG: hypothetical protein KatS3mg118_3722 [Paracoccaceae bacterium]|nr:MAG: hypothetical protein KatS3mg118_3722 [Paracoccaceae bacterium]